MRSALRLTLGLLLAGCSTPAAPAGERPPNVVIVYADDLGYADLGCFGAKDIRTPHLDRMAREGIRFTDFYVAQAVCSASRAALLTGCYPNRVGILGALDHTARHGLHPDERTIADLLKARGYATAIHGKWHLGHLPEFLPTRHGFDEYFGLPYSNDMWPKHPTAGSRYPPLPLYEGERVVQEMPDQTKLTGWYAEHAVSFIERHRERPFFLYVPHAMPHVPLHASEAFRGKSAAGLYGDVIEEIDASVGRILETIRRCGLDERTLVIFASDNGPWLSYGDHAGSRDGLREGKGTSFEGGVRVPCVMRWPGRIPAGHVCREPVMTIDLLPTIAAFAGARLGEKPIDGKDVGALVMGNPDAKSPHEALFFWWGRELQAVRSGRWKLHMPHPYQALKEAGSGGTPGKYEKKQVDLALYDLETDPAESKNLADRHPDEVARLHKLLEDAADELGDDLTQKAGRGVRNPGRR